MSKKQSFFFIGKAPFSKSLLNRALIVKSWFPDFKIQGSSLCEDILTMKYLTENLHKKKEFDCGLSGTAFRFFTTRLSRKKGIFFIKTSPLLLKRPLDETFSLLSQLSVSLKKIKEGFILVSKGWKIQGDGIYIPGQVTSQNASALLLNSWNLDKDLYFNFSSSSVSYSYFQMTLKFLQSLGLRVYQNKNDFCVIKNQSLKVKDFPLEQDKSCLFALACFASLKGQATFLDWKEESLQADHIFPEILKNMQVPISLKNNQLKISQSSSLKSIDISLKDNPDLFPMLAILCAKAEGISYLRDISHIAFKESNRLEKIYKLLSLCHINCKKEGSYFVIEGKTEWNQKISPFVFDPEEDHRIVMATELLKSLNISIELKNKDCVKKSFPEFYSYIL
ncbi:MAG: hypothetical protein GDA46_04080 [Bdellovibrionales bacterium]|nr:hypothetical protein [Bdellovibrionales bacterium]